MSQIPIQKTVFSKDTYGRVIDTQFRQLITQDGEDGRRNHLTQSREL